MVGCRLDLSGSDYQSTALLKTGRWSIIFVCVCEWVCVYVCARARARAHAYVEADIFTCLFLPLEPINNNGVLLILEWMSRHSAHPNRTHLIFLSNTSLTSLRHPKITVI